MHEAGRTSWRIEIDEPQPLVIGLFVRDVAGLPSRHVWLPPAAPATPRSQADMSEDVSRQWDLWWDRALCADWTMHGQSQELAASWWSPPDFEALRSAPALREVVARHFVEALAWSQDRKRDHVELMTGIPDPRQLSLGRRGRGPLETSLVADLERTLGRRAQPFHLRITAIPVAGKEMWQLDPHHVLITAGLLGDSEEYRKRIDPF